MVLSNEMLCLLQRFSGFQVHLQYTDDLYDISYSTMSVCGHTVDRNIRFLPDHPLIVSKYSDLEKL